MPISQQGALNTTSLIVPDLYVQIVPPSVTLLNGVPTNILGVVGTATWGPVGSPTIVGNMNDYANNFGALQNRTYDMGTAVAAAVLQGASNFRCIRVTDGTDATASGTAGTGTGITITAKYTGTLGNSLSVIIGAGTNSTSGTPTFKVTVQLPNQLAEVFDNIGGTGNALFVNMANAINQGTSGLRGPSNLVVATAGSGTTAPSVPLTVTMSGGTDGVATITTSVMIGLDTVPRKGMYALRGTGASVAVLADLSDSTSWSTQVTFGLSEGIYMVMTGPAGDSISNATSTKSTAGIDSYAAKLLFGDWIYWLDTVNSVTRLVSPQGFVAGSLSNLSPQNSSLNKQIYGIVGTQKSFSNQVYSSAELQTLGQAGIDLITNPIPAGAQFGVRFGHNTSSNAVIHGDNYTRMTNYIASTINAGMGLYIGQLASDTERLNAKATLDAFFAGLKQQKMIQDWQTILDKTNNPQNRVALGYQQADIKVIYLSVIEFLIVNIQGGQSVQIARTSTQPSA